jgi:hypothetical protein
MKVVNLYFVEELRGQLGSSAASAWFHELAEAKHDAAADCDAASDLQYYMAGIVRDVMQALLAERYNLLVLPAQ